MTEGLAYRARSFDLSEIEGLSARTLELHQQIYRRHVDAVNGFLRAAPGPPSSAAAPAPAAWADFAHEYNGMVLHEIFFEGLTGALGAIPPHDGAFRRAVDECFGSFEAWKSDIRQRAAGVAPGWALCMRDRAGRRIFNCRIESHAVGLPAADVILAIDLWEHAWQGDYGAGPRDHYVDAVLTQIDWVVIERRCRGEYRP